MISSFLKFQYDVINAQISVG